MDSYNGYSPRERMRKLRALIGAMEDDLVKDSYPPCQLCGDPEVACAYHSEDYSEPYRWRPPAMYSVCDACHARLHSRFKRPESWEIFKAHLRRGGYASDTRVPEIAREIARYRAAKRRGESPRLGLLHKYRRTRSTEWWARLTLDPRAKTMRWARPRK
jgi:hypothetical protein